MLFTAWVREATRPPGSSQEPGSIHASVQSSAGKKRPLWTFESFAVSQGGTTTAAAGRGGPGVACGAGSGAGTRLGTRSGCRSVSSHVALVFSDVLVLVSVMFRMKLRVHQILVPGLLMF